MFPKILSVSICLTVLSGCVSNSSKESSLTQAQQYQALVESVSQKLDTMAKQNAELKASLEQQKKAAEQTSEQFRDQLQRYADNTQGQVQQQEIFLKTSSSPVPPILEPGHCYAKVVIPATFETRIQKVEVQPKQTKLVLEPAEYAMVEEKVMVTPEWEEQVVVPPTYKTVEEKVLVKDATSELVRTPAVYKTIEEKVVIRPAHTTWKIGRGPIEKLDEATGEIMCAVEVPEEFKMVKRKVEVQPELVVENEVPAEYEMITRQVVDQPAHTKIVIHPAEYRTVMRKKETRPAGTRHIIIPPVYEDHPKTVMVSDKRMDWKEILCETNTTPTVVKQLQAALTEAGYNAGPVDGQIGWYTLNAIRQYQKANNLARGGLTLQTLEHLGVKPELEHDKQEQEGIRIHREPATHMVSS